MGEKPEEQSVPGRLLGGGTGLGSGKRMKRSPGEPNELGALGRGLKYQFQKRTSCSSQVKEEVGVVRKFGLGDFLKVSVEVTGLDLKVSSVRRK